MRFLELLRAYAANEEPQDNPRFSAAHLAMPVLFVGLAVVLSGCMAPSPAVQRHDVNVMWKDEAPAAVPAPSPTLIESTPAEPTPAFRIEGQSEAAVGELVELVARGDSQGWAWHSYGGHRFATADGNSRLFFSTAKPGSYEFALGAFDGKNPVIVSHFVTIRGVAPPTPEPDPVPTPVPPDPVPTPPPHVSKVYALIAYESKSVTPEQARVYTNLRDGTAAKYLKDKGHLLDIVDQNKHPAAKFAPFKSLPELILLPLEGRYEAAPVWRGPMPATADGVTEQIKRVGG